MEDLTFLFSKLWRFLFQYRKILITAAILGALCGFLADKLATPRYQSEAVTYPANEGDNSIQLRQGSIMVVMQLLQSSILRNKVIEEFNLIGHYDIDTSRDEARKNLYDQYNDNIDFAVTEYKAIRIQVRDRNPEFAAGMANGIVRLTNDVMESIVKENSRSVLLDMETELTTKELQVNRLLDSLDTMKGNDGDPVEILKVQNKYQWNVNYLNELRSQYERTKSDFERSVKGLYLVSAAEAAVEPYGYNTLVKILVAMFLTFLCALGILLLVHKVSVTS